MVEYPPWRAVWLWRVLFWGGRTKKALINRFRISLTAFEKGLWLTGVLVITGTALVFVTRSHVLGQTLTILFAVFYGVISWQVRYYGEMLTYLCMSAPMALISLISWQRMARRQQG